VEGARMSGRRAKRERREAKNIVREFESLIEKHVLEPDPEHPGEFIFNKPSRVIELCKADPNVYKTPAGNMLTLTGPDGVDRWMTPAQAEEWKIRADVLDADNPAGMGFGGDDKWFFEGGS
jgi:hypothetical protein